MNLNPEQKATLIELIDDFESRCSDFEHAQIAYYRTYQRLKNEAKDAIIAFVENLGVTS